ncbi:thioester reductase domain-containing protein [Actinomadura barringtoniae]|uniref:Thioester reductase domain-containing protein n=1 Tax=Actinomadura barringtoniae TaxID=1427535 RepID=A0A939P7G9_9ACTN|nr:thioester reductase domain-containing protein [Actinomadura barringtoniae]MBO2446895.1 thioester reductase domain-containing protein [Actinomadura barringtoniae]
MDLAPPPAAILLTGATGFLGAHVCAELLIRYPSARIFCLIRADGAERAGKRLARNFKRLRLGDERSMGRLVPVPGDLSKPRLGLSEVDYGELAERVEAIYHCAANLSLVASYEALIPANVTGTQEIIRLARQGSPKHLHHVSSLGVFLAGRRQGLTRVDEATLPAIEDAGPVGYAMSKVAGELAVHDAAPALPVTIYRPGLIFGQSRTGISTNDDMIAQILRVGARVGCLPDSTAPLHTGCVDDVARWIVALAAANAPGRVFHPATSGEPTFAEMVGHFRALGHRMEPVPIRSWWREVEERERNAASLTVRLARTAIDLVLGDPDPAWPHIESTTTATALRRLGHDRRAPGASYFHALSSHLVALGKLPAPGARPVLATTKGRSA